MEDAEISLPRCSFSGNDLTIFYNNIFVHKRKPQMGPIFPGI
jgi:hypothetical protein